MAVAMAAGVATSFALETGWLAVRERMALHMAAATALGMSLISMLTMEAAENAVELALTGGVVDVYASVFWAKLAAASAAGFVAPLPFNYRRLKLYGRACH